MEIFFQQSRWKMKESEKTRIFKLATVFNQIDEIRYFFMGFLLNDYVALMVTYTLTAMFMWVTTSIHPILCIISLVFIAFVCMVFTDQIKEIDETIPVESDAFTMSLIVYFTHRRISAYMSWRKGFIIFFLSSLMFLTLPPSLFAIVVPLAISSLLLTTEKLVLAMRVKID